MKCILELPEVFEFVGLYDSNPEHAKAAAEQFSTMAFHNTKSLIEACDVVDIVTPTINHYESASMAIRSLKHVFIEKPVTTTSEEARSLIALAKEAGV
ncbi:MAG: Gfo/Idh/MocA family protein, partial [Flavobacteriales bacterium]